MTISRLPLILFVLAYVGCQNAVTDQDWKTAKEFPNTNLSDTTAGQREEALKVLREDNCLCGREGGQTKLAECLIDHPDCTTSPKIVAVIAELAKRNCTAEEIRATYQLRQAVLDEIKSDNFEVHWMSEQQNSAVRGPVIWPNNQTNAPNRVMLYFLDDSRTESSDDPNSDRYHRKFDDGGAFISAFDYPWRLQRTLELLNKDFLKPEDVEKVQKQIAEQMKVIDDASNYDDQLQHRLIKIHANGYAIFDEAVVNYFKAEDDFIGAEIGDYPRRYLSNFDPAKIHIKTIPLGAQLSYALKDVKADKFGRVPKTKWYPLGDTVSADWKDTFVPIGKNVRFKAYWASKGKSAESAVELKTKREKGPDFANMVEINSPK